MDHRISIGGSLLLAALLLQACSTRSADQQAQSPGCQRGEGALPASATLDGHSGEYALTLVATTGQESGQSTQGHLWLHEQSAELRQYVMLGAEPDPSVSAPLYGAAQVDLEAVGAVLMGDLGSLDPAQPGVLVLERRSESGGLVAVEITLRLGSLSNRRGVVTFDAGYTALQVRSVQEGQFAGEWASGDPNMRAQGYFCAVRTGDARR